MLKLETVTDLPTNHTISNNHDINDRVAVIIILVDFACPSEAHDDERNHLQNLQSLRKAEHWLKNRFLRQQLGKKKWLLRRELKYKHYFPLEFMDDQAFVLNHIRKYGYGYRFASKALKSKPQLILEAIQHNDLSSIDNPNLLKDREFIQKCVQLSGPSIRHFINQALDREIVLAAVKQDGHALAYFRQTDFHNDREVVSQAVQQNGRALEYASVKLRADKEIVLQAVRQDPSAIQYACHELQLDSDVFLASICPNVAHKYSNTNWNNNATWLFETLKHDPEFIMDAVSRNGFSLEHASIDLKGKKEIVLAAVRNQPHALKYAVDDLKNDREVVLEAAQRDGTSLQYASTRLRSDKELILLTNILAFEYASNTLKNDKDFVLKILRKFGGAALQYVGYSLRSDKDVVLQAVSMADRHYRTLEHASKSLLKDRDVVLAAVKACGLALLCVSELWGHDKEIVLEAVKHDKLAFNYATKELKADKDVVWAAMGSGLKGVQVLDKQEAVEIVRRYGRALDYLPDVYQNDHDVMLEAAIHGGYVMDEYCEEFLRNHLARRMEHCYFGVYLGEKV
ncbi:hypothetical protein C9374_013738 [Naegleria lovaniensis]|uniref:DUF4116 domain-containing protein n=1 Tax=Naegleria lovaniensis TaxID=51637 RepID=A0AA88KH85_NAELO|nr:uncharacterized protein C9374_013738 [Naegleria lovaniensis]KAG2370903.1 hypothetical protein C9374_013738 [Naegleria lovaniensis]